MRKDSGEGHPCVDVQGFSANAGSEDEADQLIVDTQGWRVSPSSLESTIAEIRYWHRQRCFSMEQRKRANLALGSFLRSALGWSLALPQAERDRINKQASDLIDLGELQYKAEEKARKNGNPPSPPISDEPAYMEWQSIIAASIAARAPFDAIEKQAEMSMKKLSSRRLPVWASWGEAIRGFGPMSLAIIVAEAGDISNYSNPAKLWKRMGVGVIDGVRQGGLMKSADKDQWIAHGYNRMRRSRMWNIGDALIKGNGDGEFRQVYLTRKEFERAKAETAGLTVAPAAKIPEKHKAEFMSDGHIHRRAQRYMEKRLLKKLWQAWRAASQVTSSEVVPAKNTGEA